MKNIDYQLHFVCPQSRQKGRVMQQRELAKKIVEQIKEVDFAKQHHQQRLRAAEEEKQNILDSKLKPKGRLLEKKEW